MEEVKKHKREINRQKMVGWYDPKHLGKTAVEVLISTIFGRHADKRVMQALADPGGLTEKCYYEVVGRSDKEFWFDYISDVGDGFDSTYTMAYHMTRPVLPLAQRKNESDRESMMSTHETQRGEMLIFGGDEVYPTAAYKTYNERLISLYKALFPKKSAKPTEKPDNKSMPVVFAVPGNHDWYDSLVAFSDIFFSSVPPNPPKYFAGWRTMQNRSYFAVKLPMGWWLFGTDMQLGSSLDNAQIDYFKRVMKDVKADDRIILCNAEPHWITAQMYKNDPAYNNRNLGYFEGGVLKGRTAIYVAGDRHYYRRHEEISRSKTKTDPASKSKVQKIVAGGGGAFLHPTHNEHVNKIGRRDIFELRASYPDEPVSKRLTYWNLLFPLWNLKFGLVTGTLYLLTAQAFLSDLGKFSVGNLTGAIKTVVSAALTQPVALFWTVLIFAGFLLFTDTHSKPYRYVAGPIHALTHLTAVFFIGWFAAYFVGVETGVRTQPIMQLLKIAGIVFLLGSVAGPMIMGIYLLVSLNFFGRHHNEAFSSIKIADYKNFLRFKIDETSGDLTIFPVGVQRVVTSWKAGDKKKDEPDIIPANIKPDNEAFLIEEPIVFVKGIPKPATNSDAVETTKAASDTRGVESRTMETGAETNQTIKVEN